MKLPLISIILGTLLVLVPISTEAKTYENARYTFEYPSSCKLDKKENRFSTANAILECNGDASIQFESNPETSAALEGSSDYDLISDMESVFESNYDNADIVETGTDKYNVNNFTAPYIIGTYDQGFSNAFGFKSTEPYVLMTTLIKLDEREIVLLQYRNSEDDFDKHLPMVEKIIQSVKGLPNRTPITELIDETDTTTDTGTYSSNKYPETSKLCNDAKSKLVKDLCDTLLNK